MCTLWHSEASKVQVLKPTVHELCCSQRWTVLQPTLNCSAAKAELCCSQRWTVLQKTLNCVSANNELCCSKRWTALQPMLNCAAANAELCCSKRWTVLQPTLNPTLNCAAAKAELCGISYDNVQLNIVFFTHRSEYKCLTLNCPLTKPCLRVIVISFILPTKKCTHEDLRIHKNKRFSYELQHIYLIQYKYRG